MPAGTVGVNSYERAAYADMLHDTERNQKYYEGLRRAVEAMHAHGKPANVLDIGTGTGLLSMMAVRCGADTVTAIEVFQPMADCALRVIKENGFAGKINLIRKRSTEVTVGKDGDMAQRANILVTEVFDTELIGEGAQSTFHHAHKTLLEDDCIVVPSAANMYIQIVHSEHVRRWNQFQNIPVQDDTIKIPPEVNSCPGPPSLHDLQLDQVTADLFQPVTDPIKVFRFDYSGKSSIEFRGQNTKKVCSLTTGQCDAMFMWWDLEMDTNADLILSCAPRWAHPTPNDMQWRDHWMQAIYYPPDPLPVEQGEEFHLHSFHDEYSLWFDAAKLNGPSKVTEPPTCHCGAHIACSRQRLGMLGDPKRSQSYVEAMARVVNEDSVCLCLSDGSLLPLIAAKLGAKRVYALESEALSRQMIERFVLHNNLSDKIKVLEKRPEELTSKDLDEQQITLMLGEPYFHTSMLPWHNIYFWYSRTELQPLLAPKHKILPCCATIRAIGVEFKDLWKIRAPVGNCEGFNLDTFDKIIEQSSDIADDYVEPQPLWEYPGKPVTEPFALLDFDFSKPLQGLKTVIRQGVIGFKTDGVCNGVAVWLDFHLGNRYVITTGLMGPPKPGENLSWEVNSKQGVHLLKRPVKVEVGPGKNMRLKYKLKFKPALGEFSFHFDVVS